MTSELFFFSFQKRNSFPQDIGQNDDWHSGKNEEKSQNLNKQKATAMFWQLNQ